MDKVCPKGAQRRSERKMLSWQQGDGRADQFRSHRSWCSGDLWWKLDLLLWNQGPRDRVHSGSMLALPEPRRPDRANPSTNFWWSCFWQHWHDLHALGSHCTDSQQGILCWGFKGNSVGRGQHSSNRIRGISTRTMHQSTTPSLSQTIWPRWASRQFLSLPIVQILLPVTFAYSLSSRKR